MVSDVKNTGRNGGGSSTTTAEPSTTPTTLDASKAVSSSPPAAGEPQITPPIHRWLASLLGQGAEAAHVFCQTAKATLTYQVEGYEPVVVDIGARNFVIIEIPANSDPMTGPGYMIVSRANK